MKTTGVLMAGAVLVLAGCGSSPPTRFYALAAMPGPAEARPAEATPVTVADVRVPPTLDRREMVRSGEGTAVIVSGRDRWAAPLDDMSRTVLSEDLAVRLPPNAVVPPGAPVPPRTARIVVAITRFEPAVGGRAVLAGSWSLVRDGASAPELRQDFALDGPAAAGGEAQAAAMSGLLGRLASCIAATLAAPANGQNAS